jgi:hypothetical protein
MDFGIDNRRRRGYAAVIPTLTTTNVLFDEAHSEAWTIRPELASQMQPAHPDDASYARAAAALAARDFRVMGNGERELSPETLAECDLLVIAHPSNPQWERTTGTGSPRLSAAELDGIEAFVRGGGGLIVLGETEQEKYGNNVNELLERFEIRLGNDTVQDYAHSHMGVPSWVLGELSDGQRGAQGDLLARVHAACFYRATTISSSNGARVLARAHASASHPGAPLLVASEHGSGRIVVLADSDLFGDDCIEELDHLELWLNLCYWVSGGRQGASRDESREGVEHDPAWTALRDHTNALALVQAADGSLNGDPGEAREHLAHILDGINALAPRFPHQAEYLQAVLEDLRAWEATGFPKPDFTRSLEAFRPELQRQDGIVHLVFFPMYKQNGSRDTCCEALLVRVPWPDWIAELERTRYDNPKYVPVELLDSTRGYVSECAVLFPETVSVAGRPVNHFGAIFCDREAARLRRIAGAAADLLAINLPPDAAALLASPEISQQAYILWDMIHDRTHSHGELPFDPFMIRQRSPYWMYSLEELRCDLTTFGEATALEEEIPFARHVQYAILLDRLLRFPITGSRVRNYDGLGGQLLFAHLHRQGHISWADNQLTINWETVGDGVTELRNQIEMLYREGIDRTKLQHWSAAHDLIAANVTPAAGSNWVKGVRDFTETADPRPYVDLVLEDEFPLSIFYTTLKAKLAA